jgi:O-antigen/teichoic acid export membrane protein
MKRDYALTFGTEGLVIAAYLVTLRVVAQGHGQVGFGEYALSRRALAMLGPLVIMGLDVGITKFTASSETSAVRAVHAAAGLVLSIGATAVAALVIVGFVDPLTQLLFGSSAYRELTVALIPLLAGTALHMVAYSYLRGRLQVARANAVMLLNQAIAPLLLFLLSPASVATTLTWLGIAWIVVSAGFLATIPLRLPSKRDVFRSLAIFSLPRLPGDFLQVALFAAPGVLIAHASTIGEAGVVALGVSVVAMVGSALGPIGVLLLPTFVRMRARGQAGQLRGHVGQVLWPTLALLLVGTVVAELVAPTLIERVLGLHPESVTALRVQILAAVPWGIYVTLRAVIDAGYDRPVNAINMFASFVVFALIVAVFRADISSVVVCAAFTMSMYVLAALTLLRVRAVLGTDAPVSPETTLVEAGAGLP